MSDRSANLSGKKLRFARSATKHRVSRERIRYVITHCGLAFGEPAPGGAKVMDARLVCLGDDVDGRAIEVIAVEGSKGELIVIHAMALRKKYRDQYEEAKRWRL
ncbi:MAG TPA: hypothetical protein VIH71_13190 [Solirubrobacteraceae bacterium]